MAVSRVGNWKGDHQVNLLLCITSYTIHSLLCFQKTTTEYKTYWYSLYLKHQSKNFHQIFLGERMCEEGRKERDANLL